MITLKHTQLQFNQPVQQGFKYQYPKYIDLWKPSSFSNRALTKRLSAQGRFCVGLHLFCFTSAGFLVIWWCISQCRRRKSRCPRLPRESVWEITVRRERVSECYTVIWSTPRTILRVKDIISCCFEIHVRQPNMILHIWFFNHIKANTKINIVQALFDLYVLLSQITWRWWTLRCLYTQTSLTSFRSEWTRT